MQVSELYKERILRRILGYREKDIF